MFLRQDNVVSTTTMPLDTKPAESWVFLLHLGLGRIILGPLYGNDQVQASKDQTDRQPLRLGKGMTKHDDGYHDSEKFACRGNGGRVQRTKPGKAQKDEYLAQGHRGI